MAAAPAPAPAQPVPFRSRAEVASDRLDDALDDLAAIGGVTFAMLAVDAAKTRLVKRTAGEGGWVG